jgi:tyrosine-protein kinase Etk/Wzc
MGPITSLPELWAAFKRQFWLMLLVIGIGLPAAYWYALTRPHEYEAAAVISIEGPATGEPDVSDPGLMTRLNEIQQVILSRESLIEFADRFGLFPGAPGEAVRVALTRNAIMIHGLGNDMGQRRPTGLHIAVRLGERDQAAAFANAVAQAYLDEDARRAHLRLDAAIQRSIETQDYLSSEQARVEEEISALEAEVAEFQTANAASLPENIEDQQQRRLELAQQHAAAEREIAFYERGSSQFSSEVTERHIITLRRQIETLEGELATLDAAISAAPEVERQLSEFDRHLQSLQAELAAITTTRTQVSLDQRLSGREEYRMALAEAAVPPEFSMSRSRTKVALAGGMAVVFAAVGLALAREFLQKAIRSAGQMRKQLDIEPVVVIPYIRTRGTSMRRLGYGAFFLGVFLLTVFAGAAVLAEAGRTPSLKGGSASQDV